MNDCGNWNEALLDHAAGRPATPELTRHLERCAGCRARRDRLVGNADLIDATLDQWIGRAEPSAGFDDRLLRTAADQRSARRFTGWGMALAASLLLALMLGGLVELPRSPLDPTSTDSTAPTLWAWTSPTASLLNGTADPLLRTTPRVGRTYLDLNADGSGRPAEGE